MTASSIANRLVLGTVQLGQAYGIANRSGRPGLETAEAIVRRAWEGGVREFDTAQGYGESEQTLGTILGRLDLRHQARVITKFAPWLDHASAPTLRKSLDRSLESLGVATLEGIMLHREAFLDIWDRGLGEFLLDIRKQGLAREIGVSVFTPEKALVALRMDGIGMIQLPSNLMDRRFERAGVFETAVALGKTVYVRSVFLQGLLLMEPEELPESMGFAAEALKKAGQLADRFWMDRRRLALLYAREAYSEARVLFGAERPEQVAENLSSFAESAPPKLCEAVRKAFPDLSEEILDPARWPKEQEGRPTREVGQ